MPIYQYAPEYLYFFSAFLCFVALCIYNRASHYYEIMNKPALLIVNLGTPDSPSYYDVFKYLREFLMDGRVIDVPAFFRFILVTLIICPFRSFSSGKIYKQLWNLSDGESPLLKNTRELTNQLKQGSRKI